MRRLACLAASLEFLAREEAKVTRWSPTVQGSCPSTVKYHQVQLQKKYSTEIQKYSTDTLKYSTGLLSLNSQIFRCRCRRNAIDETRTSMGVGTLRHMTFFAQLT